MKRLIPSALVVLAALAAAPAYAQLAPPNKDGLTFGQMAVNVRNIEEHKKVWVEFFDGKLVEKNGITAIKWPGMLMILNKAEPTSGSQGAVLDHFGFKVKDTAALAERWRAAGREVQGAIFTGSEGFPNIYLMGPDGVRIELQEDKTMKESVIGYHMHFLTPGFTELRDWYVNTLGLEPFKRGTIATTANAPGMNLSFGNAREKAPPTKGRAIDHIGFEIKGLEAYCKMLEGKGVKFDVPLHLDAKTGIKSAFITDPLGTYIELTEGLTAY